MPAPFPFPREIDNTMRSSWKACKRQWAFRFGGEWAGPLPSVHLHAGAAFARGLEVARIEYYLNGRPADEAVACGWAALVEAYGDFVPVGRTNKTLHRMGEALVSYFDEYPLDTDDLRPVMTKAGKPAVEFNFGIPLPLAHPETGDPIIYCGRFDMLAKANEQLFVVDEKTTQSLGDYWASRYALSAQFTGYCWAAQQFGFPVTGAMIRGVGILKESFKHVQLPLMRPDFMIQEWYDELLNDVEEMVHCWKANRFGPDLASSCGSYGGCDYASVCQIHPNGRENFLSVNFIKRKWEPLKGDDSE